MGLNLHFTCDRGLKQGLRDMLSSCMWFSKPLFYCQLSPNTCTFITNQICSIISIIVVIIICTAGREKVCSCCNPLAGGVTAALFILRHTPSDSAERRSEEGCSPLITASVINSFIQGCGKRPFSFTRLKIERKHTLARNTRTAEARPRERFICLVLRFRPQNQAGDETGRKQLGLHSAFDAVF